MVHLRNLPEVFVKPPALKIIVKDSLFEKVFQS